MKAPVEVRCVWTKREGEPGVYDCPHCGQWTANLPAHRLDVCPALDRRKGKTDRRAAPPQEQEA